MYSKYFFLLTEYCEQQCHMEEEPELFDFNVGYHDSNISLISPET